MKCQAALFLADAIERALPARPRADRPALLPPTPPTILHVTHQHAEWIFGQLQPRGRIVLLSRGHLSLTDLIAAAVKRSGPARITICVWGISYEDVGLLQSLRDSGAATSVRLLVPPKPPHTATKSKLATDGRPTGPVDDYDALRAIFGRENVILTATHAKIATVQNDRWSIAIRGSMNMYACSHAEQSDIDDSPEICALVDAYAASPQQDAAYPNKAQEPSRARAALEQLVPGARLFGITAGFSLGALLSAALEKTGPARVSVITARCGKKEADVLAALPDSRLVLGQSVVALAKETARHAEQAMTPERVRVAMVHAKIVTIRNDRWNLVIRSSMNLSQNLRAEQFDVCDDAAIADQADAWIGEIFEQTPPGIWTAQTTLSNVERHFFCRDGNPAPALPQANAFRPIALPRRGAPPIRLPRAPSGALPLPPRPLAAPPPPDAGGSSPPRA